MFSFGTSKSGSSQTSRPISAGDVGEYYRNAWGWAGAEPSGEYPDFDYYMLGGENGEDYDRLEKEMSATPLRRLGEDYATQKSKFMAEMRKRGIADDPAAFQLEQETLGTPYQRAQSDILSNAANQRYQLQSQELQGLSQALNQYKPQSWTNQRDYWLNKMDRYYRGMGQESSGSSSSKSFNIGLGY